MKLCKLNTKGTVLSLKRKCKLDTNYFYFDEFCLKGTQIFQFSFNCNIFSLTYLGSTIWIFIFRDKPFTNGNLTTPSFYVGKLHIPKDPEDTYLDMSSWGKVIYASYLVSWFHTGKQNGSGSCQLPYKQKFQREFCPKN